MDYHHTKITFKFNLLISLWLTALLVLVEVTSCAKQYHARSFLSNEADLVTDLPGQPDVSFRHYAGYVPVDKSNGSRALFYWFFEAMDLPKEKPLVLWLNGGPGCSSVGYGATQEIGPFLADTNKNGLIFNPYAWNKEVNVLFLDSPVGVGFSYSNTKSDYSNLDDDFSTRDAYTFICNWFDKFPEYRGNEFYMAGESYAGIYVPMLAEVVYDNNNKNNDSSLHINLKGFLLGNPRISNVEDWKGWVDYAWSHAVISDETHKIISKSCNFSGDYWSNDECIEAIDEVDKQYKEIDMYSLYTSVCKGNSKQSSSYFESAQFKTNSDITSKRMPPRRLSGYDPCLDDYVSVYYNRADVQKSIHASDGVHLKNWTICTMEVFNNWNYTRLSVLSIYEKLIAAGGLRIWVYSGDTDGCIPVLATRNSLSSLKLPIKTAWRPWYHEKQVSGWVQEYVGLTFATFKGAGHAVPSFKPSNSLALFSAFLKGLPLSSSRFETEIKF